MKTPSTLQDIIKKKNLKLIQAKTDKLHEETSFKEI